MMAATASIDLLSDWRVGTGSGVPGGVDRVTAHDEHSLPYIPGKTLTGVWRDAAEVLARGLDDRAAGTWRERVSVLFGDQPGGPDGAAAGDKEPSPARVSIRSARLADDLRAALAGRKRRALREALVHVRPGVAISEATGTALPDHLRFDEVARAGLRLEARVTVDLDDFAADERRRLLALLQGSAHMIDRLGADRRRGLGRCRVCLDAGVDPLKELASDGPLSRPPARTAEQGSSLGNARTDQVLELDLSVEARSPLLLAPHVTGNLQRGEDFVPGGMLLGRVLAAVDAALGQRGTAGAALRAGALRVGCGVPVVAGAPGTPVPLCLQRYKDGRGFEEDGGVLNGFAADEDVDERRQPKGLRAGWIGAPADDERLPPHREVARVTRLHGVIRDSRQRPDANGLYAYDAVAAGERFVARVTIGGETATRLRDGEALRRAVEGTLALGRSKKDDYGEARLTATVVAADEDSTPDGRPYMPGGRPAKRITVLVLSPVLLIDKRERPAPTVEGLRAEVAARLGVKLAVPEVEGRSLAAVRTVRMEGWAVKWGLPRETLVGLAAGSVVRFDVDGILDPERLRELERWGIGERTAEGYGAVRFDPPLLASASGGRKAAAPQAEAGNAGAGAPPVVADVELAKRLEDAAWRREIARAAVEAAETQRPLGASLPSPTQLAGLRPLLASGRSASILRQWLGDDDHRDKEARRKRRRFLRDRNWTEGALDRLASLHVGDTLWEILDKAARSVDVDVAFTREALGIVRETEALRSAHHEFALRALIDAVVRHERHRETD